MPLGDEPTTPKPVVVTVKVSGGPLSPLASTLASVAASAAPDPELLPDPPLDPLLEPLLEPPLEPLLDPLLDPLELEPAGESLAIPPPSSTE
jgi:hypothetical protein